MGKTKNTNARVEDDAVEPSLQAVQKFYDTGRRSLDRHPGGRMPYGGVATEAERLELHPEMLRKARAFAAAYPEERLDRLFKLCRQHRYALGVSHVIRLLSVPDKRRRTALQRRVVTEAWSYAELEFAILKEQGIRSPTVGRRRRVPADGHEACLQLARLCEQWRRAALALRGPSGTDQGNKPDPVAYLLPDAVSLQLNRAEKVLAALSKLVNGELEERLKNTPLRSQTSKSRSARPRL
jgi:hypothetical protein